MPKVKPLKSFNFIATIFLKNFEAPKKGAFFMPVPIHHTDWIFFILSMTCLLVLIARLADVSRFKMLLNLPLSNISKGVSKDFDPLNFKKIHDIALAISGGLSLSLAVYLLQHNVEEPFEVLGFLNVFVVVNGMFLLKSFIAALAAWLFGRVEQISESQNVWLAFLTCLSLLLIPLLWGVFYIPMGFFAGKILVSIALLVGFLGVFTVTVNAVWSMRVAPSYKILYLCTLEIAPLLLLTKWYI